MKPVSGARPITDRPLWPSKPTSLPVSVDSRMTTPTTPPPMMKTPVPRLSSARMVPICLPYWRIVSGMLRSTSHQNSSCSPACSNGPRMSRLRLL